MSRVFQAANFMRKLNISSTIEYMPQNTPGIDFLNALHKIKQDKLKKFKTTMLVLQDEMVSYFVKLPQEVPAS